jgi:C4-dicarboxylate-specific signal transduction histidine kinase
VTDPSEDIDAKLARVHAVLARLESRIATETRDRSSALAQLANEIRAERDRDDMVRRTEARADTRVAAAGLTLAALGAIVQIIGTAVS